MNKRIMKEYKYLAYCPYCGERQIWWNRKRIKYIKNYDDEW